MNSKARMKVVTFLVCIMGVCVFLGGQISQRFSVRLLTVQDKRPCACESCLLEDDPWVTKRFDKSVQLFLSANYNLPEDAFNWWKGLQNEGRSFSTYITTVSSLFQILPPSPDVVAPSPDRCRTCAVVGNSVNLKGSHYGHLIDFQDVVIRMNYGRTKGFEADVGTKTTHRVMYPESATDLDNTTHLVLVPFKIMDLEWVMKALTTGFSGRSYTAIRSHIKANKDLVMVVNPAFMRYVQNTWLGKTGGYPSTGFMTLVLAMHMCDEVHVFGYGADNDGNWSHYFEKLSNKKFKTGLHPGTHEYKLIKELADKHKLWFYTGQSN